MAASGTQPLWRPALDLSFLVLCVALVLSLVRAIDMPVRSRSPEPRWTFVPADVALACSPVLLQRLLGRGSLPRPARAAARGRRLLRLAPPLVALNGADAFVAAVKLLEYGALALGFVLFVRRRIQLWISWRFWSPSPSSRPVGRARLLRVVDADFTGSRSHPSRASTSSRSSRR